MKKVFSLVLAVFICFTLALCFAGCKGESTTNSNNETGFVKPTGYASIVEVTINPKVNLYLDSENKVLAVEYINKDAEDIYKEIETELVGKDIKACVSKVVEKAAEKGFLTENKKVTINMVASLDTVNKNDVLANAVEGASQVIEEKKIEAEIIVQKVGEDLTDDELKDILPEKEGIESDDTKSDDTTSSEPEEQVPTIVDPNTSLKDGMEFVFIRPNLDGTLYVVNMKFNKEDKVMTYGFAPYEDEPNDYHNKTVVYNGKTYYQAGGAGGSADVEITNETLVISDGADSVTFVMNSNNELSVHAVSNFLELKVGDLFTIK